MINFFLFLSEFSINRESCCHIRYIMMYLMTLISQHHLSILKPLVVIMIMKSSCCRSTSTYWMIRLNSTTKIFLLTFVNKETFKLAFPHSRFAILHHITMCFTCNLWSPSHYLNFLIIFYNSWLSQNVVHKWFIDLGVLTNFFE